MSASLKLLTSLLLPAVLLLACAGPPQTLTRSSPAPAPGVAETDIISPSGLSGAEIQQLLMLLDAADQALKDKRLTTPAGNSALDLYRRVLRLAPANQEAQQGLETIIERYVQWSDAALSRERIDRARLYLDRAALVRTDHPLLLAAKERLNRSPRRPQQRASEFRSPQQRSNDGGDYIALDLTQLQSRSQTVKLQLQQIAEQVRERNARVLIEAPSDPIGRWVYQQLNERHEEYRIRANLRIAAQPGIRLLQ